MNLIACPACRSSRLVPFHDAGEVPVHTTLLMPTRQRALDYPRKPLALAYCETCGFIYNWRFEPGLHEYSGQCEESQACSPTFAGWLHGLASRLVNDYAIRQRSVLEIGCGKGDFLAALCRQGDNHGIGYDPAYVPGRFNAGEASSLEFHTRLWDLDCGLHGADVVVCRHTLEHIADVRRFLGDIRKSMAGRTDTLLFFEVPDTQRILETAAFWDIYYEHCSYFTRGSLDGLFREAGFDVLESWLDYDEQYILLMAKPAAGRADLPGAERHVPVAPAVELFKRHYREVRDHWVTLLEDCAGRGREVVLWGGGSKAAAFLNLIDRRGTITRVIDINPNKHNAFIPGTGQEVVAPDALRQRGADLVIAMNSVYAGEIRRTLDALGCNAELLAL